MQHSEVPWEGEGSEVRVDHVMPQAYAFEPLLPNPMSNPASPDYSGGDSSSEKSNFAAGDNEDADREPVKGSWFYYLSWYQCRHCSVSTLSYNWECICCQEIPAVRRKIVLQEDSLKCGTMNRYFSLFCLDVKSLDMLCSVRVMLMQSHLYDQYQVGKNYHHYYYIISQ